ncbi:MAG: hypothetical protein HN392_10930 [Anaerolineae bacterium]|jgi:hypothetical protein|nr:hypothetical protein [Anaerolineae bacterium]MBT7073648.1 hypothetical protein [Anaerolineae bacterium]MBT7782959.1 hypothetical protein [Anaerolineae bacterium]
MFTTNNHYELHISRHNDLEEIAGKRRLIASLQKNNGALTLRKRVGRSLIGLGQKLVEQPERELQVQFSS